MKKKTVVRITTHCFDLKINYNGPVLSSIFFLLLCIIILMLFVHVSTFRVMLFVFLGILTLISVTLLLYGFKFSTEEVEQEQGKESDSNDPPAETGEHVRKKKEEKHTSYVIKNKVPIPNPQPDSERVSQSPIEGKESNQSATGTPEATARGLNKIPLSVLENTDWGDLFTPDDDI